RWLELTGPVGRTLQDACGLLVDFIGRSETGRIVGRNHQRHTQRVHDPELDTAADGFCGRPFECCSGMVGPVHPDDDLGCTLVSLCHIFPSPSTEISLITE